VDADTRRPMVELDGLERLRQFDDLDEVYAYGEPRHRPFLTPGPFDGQVPTAPRRPEVLGPDVGVWWSDLYAWADWLIATFRLSTRFPPCWSHHSALVEELMALWLCWQAAWLPGIDPVAPAGFLRELDCAISRIDRLWRTPCTPDLHRPQPPVAAPTQGAVPRVRSWWSNPDYLTDHEARP